MAQPAPIPAPSQRLKENLVKQALKTFAWETFKQHLSTVDLNANSLSLDLHGMKWRKVGETVLAERQRPLRARGSAPKPDSRDAWTSLL